jgi:hypothetical protein
MQEVILTKGELCPASALGMHNLLGLWGLLHDFLKDSGNALFAYMKSLRFQIENFDIIM